MPKGVVVIGDFMKEDATDFKHVSVKADVRQSLPFLKSNTNCVRGQIKHHFWGHMWEMIKTTI